MSRENETPQETEDRIVGVLSWRFYRANSRWSELEDWQQEARIAIWLAQRTWNKYSNYQYGAHLFNRVRARLIDYARKNGPVTRKGIKRLVRVGMDDWDLYFQERPKLVRLHCTHDLHEMEEFEAAMDMCNSPQQKKTIFLIMNGYHQHEIADIMGVGQAVVQRHIDRIRRQYALAA